MKTKPDIDFCVSKHTNEICEFYVTPSGKVRVLEGDDVFSREEFLKYYTPNGYYYASFFDPT